jgi:phytol kinase
MTGYACAVLVLGALGALFGAARLARRRNWFSPEDSRKFVHVGMGCVCLSFPWLFSSPVPVLALAGIALASLVAVRTVPRVRAELGCVLHGVGRRSYGEFAFIAGVATAFVLARGDALSYVVPVAVLTFADSFAAIVGTRFGRHRFETPDGSKSFEGSLAFLGAAVVCVAVPLIALHRPDAPAIALTTGVALMLVEASAWAGFDNLAIPVVGGLLVRALASAAGGSY